MGKLGAKKDKDTTAKIVDINDKKNLPQEIKPALSEVETLRLALKAAEESAQEGYPKLSRE